MKLPFNKTDDPWIVAQAFLHKHNLPQDYLDTVAKYIITNAGLDNSNLGGGSGGGSSDPFTGSGRYVPSGSSAPTSNTAPINKCFPAEEYLTLETINVTLVVCKFTFKLKSNRIGAFHH